MAREDVTLSVSKHEGAGNDFIVLLDPDDAVRLSLEQIRLICDRHRGVGADGVIRVSAGRSGTDLTMELRNADGSEAEMSGNGIRCLAQAAVLGGLVTPPRFTVTTGGGVRTVDYVPGEVPGYAWANVDMGPVALGDNQPQQFPDRRAREVDVGNPHLVLFGPDPSGIAVNQLGPQIESVYPNGINVEFIALAENPDELDFRVWERGAGETLACGTGSVAAAAAAHSWGLVGEKVRVHNPGGTLEVTLGREPGDTTHLAGPVRKVADLVLEPSLLR